ncbi:MAG: methyltransferase domain-containing protein [Alphaproteobacteria bacterium]
MSPPLIFDRQVLRRRRERAAPNLPEHDFLLRHAAGDVAERLAAVNRRFARVLDLGGRRGAFLEAWRPETPPELTALSDLSFGMARRAEGGGLPVAADEERLPFAEGSFDLIVSILSLHAVNDVPGALIQLRRALKPDGLFLGVFFGPETLRELRGALLSAEAACEGGASPRVSPFVDVSELGNLLGRAGFALPVADSDRLTVRYPSVFRLLQDLRGMGETNVLHGRQRRPMRRETLFRMCAEYEAEHRQEDGRVPASFELVYAAGWSPHESQQKPLRPGSAVSRLADALNAKPS